MTRTLKKRPFYGSQSQEIAAYEAPHRAAARKAASEGIVLLFSAAGYGMFRKRYSSRPNRPRTVTASSPLKSRLTARGWMPAPSLNWPDAVQQVHDTV